MPKNIFFHVCLLNDQLDVASDANNRGIYLFMMHYFFSVNEFACRKGWIFSSVLVVGLRHILKR